MIVDKFIEITINPSNVNNLKDKEYILPTYFNEKKNRFVVKHGEKINIKVKDLTKGSRVLVRVACDYCYKEKPIPYTEYNRSINTNKFVKKYCCDDCDQLKKQEAYEIKQQLGILKRGEKGYWKFRENRLKELRSYITEYENITNMHENSFGALLLSVFKEYGERIEDCCIEMGYNLMEIREKRYNPPHFYENFENLKEGISELIEELGRFPKQKEVLNYLRISNNILLSFGGIREIKDKMGYCDDGDLIDDRGFKNASVYEYMTAQYLIENSIPYKREQYPFDGEFSRLRSDFTFYLENNKEIHVEIWGYSQKDFNSKRSVSYNEKRSIKEELYVEYNHLLIGIDYEVFQGRYEDIQVRLYEIFNPYLHLKFKKVSQDKFIPTTKLSDEELLNEIMKYSNNPQKLPKQRILQQSGKSGLYKEVLNRYDTYDTFARKFNMFTSYKLSSWNKQSIFDTFSYMLEKYGRILKNNDLKSVNDETVRGIIEGSKKIFGSFMEARLCYYEYLVENTLPIPESELQYINGAVHMKRGFNKSYLTEERLSRFKNLLDKVN